MDIEAPISKSKKNYIVIWIVCCLAGAAWLAYDGYFSKTFIKTHTNSDGSPDSTLAFNRFSPPVLVVAAAALCVYLLVIGKRRIAAGESELVICDKERIRYDSIEKIDRTHFESKGFFIITYKPDGSREIDRKLSDRNYDNLGAVLEKLVAEIS